MDFNQLLALLLTSFTQYAVQTAVTKGHLTGQQATLATAVVENAVALIHLPGGTSIPASSPTMASAPTHVVPSAVPLSGVGTSSSKPMVPASS
jgi:hypothetical protein